MGELFEKIRPKQIVFHYVSLPGVKGLKNGCYKKLVICLPGDSFKKSGVLSKETKKKRQIIMFNTNT